MSSIPAATQLSIGALKKTVLELGGSDDRTARPRADLRDAIARQVRNAVDKGAKILTGGRAHGQAGFYYEPTVLDHVRPGMAVLEEEVFGPAVPLLRARDVEHALLLANDSRYGLASAVWTSGLDRGEAFAARPDAGHTDWAAPGRLRVERGHPDPRTARSPARSAASRRSGRTARSRPRRPSGPPVPASAGCAGRPGRRRPADHRR
jgi:aldehyde dehydrogenase family protein